MTCHVDLCWYSKSEDNKSETYREEIYRVSAIYQGGDRCWSVCLAWALMELLYGHRWNLSVLLTQLPLIDSHFQDIPIWVKEIDTGPCLVLFFLLYDVFVYYN